MAKAKSNGVPHAFASYVGDGPLSSPIMLRGKAPIMVGIGSLIAIMSGIVKMTLVASDMGHQVEELAMAVKTIEANSWTISRSAEVALRTKLANPTMRVVDPREPSKFISE